MDDSKVKEFLNFHIRRKVTVLFTTFLNQLEDLREDGLGVSDDKYQRVRKRVLDSGNDCIRDLEIMIDKLNVSIKK